MEGVRDPKGSQDPRPVVPRRVRRGGHPLHVRRGAQRQGPHRHAAPLTRPRRRQPLLDWGQGGRVKNAASKVGVMSDHSKITQYYRWILKLVYLEPLDTQQLQLQYKPDVMSVIADTLETAYNRDIHAIWFIRNTVKFNTVMFLR